MEKTLFLTVLAVFAVLGSVSPVPSSKFLLRELIRELEDTQVDNAAPVVPTTTPSNVEAELANIGDLTGLKNNGGEGETTGQQGATTVAQEADDGETDLGGETAEVNPTAGEGDNTEDANQGGETEGESPTAGEDDTGDANQGGETEGEGPTTGEDDTGDANQGGETEGEGPTAAEDDTGDANQGGETEGEGPTTGEDDTGDANQGGETEGEGPTTGEDDTGDANQGGETEGEGPTAGEDDTGDANQGGETEGEGPATEESPTTGEGETGDTEQGGETAGEDQEGGEDDDASEEGLGEHPNVDDGKQELEGSSPHSPPSTLEKSAVRMARLLDNLSRMLIMRADSLSRIDKVLMEGPEMGYPSTKRLAEKQEKLEVMAAKVGEMKKVLSHFFDDVYDRFNNFVSDDRDDESRVETHGPETDSPNPLIEDKPVQPEASLPEKPDSADVQQRELLKRLLNVLRSNSKSRI